MEEKELLKIIKRAAIYGRTELDLSYKSIKSLPAEIGRLTNLTRLRLDGNQLTSVPAELSQLTSLTALYLDGNQLASVPKELGQLTNLTKIYLSRNQLTSVPKELWWLTNLTWISLSGNQLTSVPKELGQLTNLEELNLGKNQLSSIPKELGKLTKLKRLYLSGNQLTSIPKELEQLTNLTELYLHKNQLTSVPKEIGQLTNLTGLYLHKNKLKSIPKELGRLTNLTGLWLDGNQLTSIPKELGQLTNLTNLYLDANQLTSVPKELGQLTNLTWLNLAGNQLKIVPKEVWQLTNLERLYLYNNQLKSVPKELGQLRNLRELILSGNKLTSVPKELGWMTNMKEIDLEGNPLELPPPEVVKQGTKAVLAYLRALAEQKRQIWVSKLLFVGEGGVGKTSLLKRLLREEFDPDEETTHGLQIRTLEEKHPKHEDVMMSLNAWDFGGQYVLHATHQFFLTGRSLFILVWNARYGWQQAKIYYWLDIIMAQAPESPVLIVATHTEDWPADLPYEEIQNRYPQVCGRFSVSNERRTGVDKLEKAIQQQAAELPLMGKWRPASWLDVAEDVQEIAQQKNYIYPNELEQIMINRKIKKEDRGSLAGWLHDLGYILYFKENPELSNIVILNAEWVASNISSMLEDAEIETGLGIFKKEHMEAVWPEIDPPIRSVFLRLMEQFDLSFRTLEDKDISIVVERLSFDPSASAKGYEELWRSRESENEIAMKFYLNTSLPPGIPTWFIARSHRFTTYKHWRYGALFADGEEKKHLSLVRAFDHERYVTLKTRGPAPHNFFALLRDGLELTLDRYPGLNIERKIPCPGHGKETCPYEFDFKLVERALEKGKKTVECHESGDDVLVSQLLYGLDLRPDSAVMARLEVLSREIEETATVTQKRVIGRVDSLGEELIRDLGVILTELVELRELAQREFLSLFNRDQRLSESHCPNVFAVLPKDGQGWLKDLLGQKMVLQLYCQEPGEWHPAVEGAKGGRYEIKKPSEFLFSMGPYILKLAKVIKYAAPVAGAAAGAYAGPVGAVMGAKYAKDLAGQIKLMEELTKKLAERDYIEAELLERTPRQRNREAHTGDKLWVGGKAERIEGMELRMFRQLLDEVDEHHEWGGLKKVLTPEGHYLWLCEGHAEKYRK